MPTPTCENCGTPRPDNFCPQCGQPKPVRLTLRAFVSHISTHFFSLDRGVLRTMVSLFRSPGNVALEFVDGRRIWYTNPLAYWIIAATLQLLALWTVQDAYLVYLEAQMRGSMETQPEALALYAELFKLEDPIPLLASITHSAVRAGYTYLGVFLALAFAIGLRLLVKSPNREFNVAEQLVFAMYTTAHWSVITAIMLPITFRMSPTLHATIGTTGYLIITAWSSLEFHQAGARGAFRTVLAMLLAFVAYLVVFLILMVFLYGVAAVKAA